MDPGMRMTTPGLGLIEVSRMRYQGLLLVVSMIGASVLGACSSDSAKDMPEGWGNAARVKSLVQELCPGSMMLTNERASFTGGSGDIDVAYQEAHFRCEQDVEGFFKATSNTVDILVQPIDMHPTAVAGCDCGYNITFVVEPVAAGTFQTSLYRRWDGMNADNPLVPIASASVTVQ
jgi:hypothetical protein